MGGGKGGLFKGGGAYFEFWSIGGALLLKEALIRGGGRFMYFYPVVDCS